MEKFLTDDECEALKMVRNNIYTVIYLLEKISEERDKKYGAKNKIRIDMKMLIRHCHEILNYGVTRI